jgi:hypothetical protein
VKLWQYRLSGITAGLVVGSILVLGLTACDGQSDQRPTNPDGSFVRDTNRAPFTGTTVQHDDQRGVTCWVYSHPTSREGGVSCLPDWMLTPAQHKPVTDKCLVKDVGVSEACRLLLDPPGVAK